MPRATTAAWLVMPPRVVMMPTAACNALHVFRRGLDARQDHGVALRFHVHRLVGIEHELAGGRTRRSWQALGENGHLRVGVERRMEKLIELRRIEAQHGLLLGDDAVASHVDRDLQRGLGGALARAGLQHEQLAFLHGELDVLEIAEMLLQRRAGGLQIREGFRQEGFQRLLAVARSGAIVLGQGLGAYAGPPPRPRLARSEETRRTARSRR